jgi:hypothetical protein
MLKRFDTYGLKINRRIEYGERLDLRPYLTRPPAPTTSGTSEQQCSAMYRLYGVVVHHGGSTHSGHYMAYVRNAGTGDNDKWTLCDDSRVQPVHVKTVLNIPQAYMLFYVRTQPAVARVNPLDPTMTQQSTAVYGPVRPAPVHTASTTLARQQSVGDDALRIHRVQPMTPPPQAATTAAAVSCGTHTPISNGGGKTLLNTLRANMGVKVAAGAQNAK